MQNEIDGRLLNIIKKHILCINSNHKGIIMDKTVWDIYSINALE